MPNINMRDCRIVFMGTPAFAVAILQAMLAQRWGVVAVITQPDRPVGRKRTLSPTPVKEVALAHGLVVLQPERLRQEQALAQLAACAPDVIVTAAYALGLITCTLRYCPSIAEEHLYSGPFDTARQSQVSP